MRRRKTASVRAQAGPSGPAEDESPAGAAPPRSWFRGVSARAHLQAGAPSRPYSIDIPSGAIGLVSDARDVFDSGEVLRYPSERGYPGQRQHGDRSDARGLGLVVGEPRVPMRL